jgi:NTP pyrophosphatase (non-canonical NTP hydrolase)
VNPNIYQAAAARTEADPCKSASRMESMLPVDPTSPDSLHLMPVRINHAVVGLAGEVGELSQLLERWVYYGQSLSVPDVEEEVGDCLWYIALLCTAVGIPMERAMEGNLAKLKARFPHKFTEEAAANRDPTAERKASEEALEKARADVDRYGEPGMPPGPQCKATDEAMEKAKAEWISAYADGLKELIERYGGVSDKPASEIYPPPDERARDEDNRPDWALDYDEKMKRYAVQYGAAGKTTPVPRKPIDLPKAPQPGVVLPGGIPVPGVWACECGQINADCRMFCGWCNKRRKGQEDWLCECGHINLAVDPRCAKCEKPRVVESVTPKQSNPDSSGVEQMPKGRPTDQPNCDSVVLDEAQRNQSNPFGYDEAGEFEDL